MGGRTVVGSLYCGRPGPLAGGASSLVSGKVPEFGANAGPPDRPGTVFAARMREPSASPPRRDTVRKRK